MTQDFANPRRDVRAVTITTLAAVSVLYLLIAITCVVVLGPSLATTSTPIQELLAIRFGPGSAVVTATVAAALTYGSMTSYLTGAARMTAALARDGWLPRWLSRGHEAGRTPRRAGVAIGALCLLVLEVALHFGVTLHRLMVFPSAMFITVTAAGLWAGARLLPARSTRFMAMAAAIVMTIVLLGCGSAALYPLVVAVIPALTRRRSIGTWRRLRSQSWAVPTYLSGATSTALPAASEPPGRSPGSE